LESSSDLSHPDTDLQYRGMWEISLISCCSYYLEESIICSEVTTVSWKDEREIAAKED